MKQIFTLLTIALLTGTAFKAKSQNINESFETSTEVAYLQSSCWTFNNFNYTSTSPIVGAGSVISDKMFMSEIITPELVMPSSLIVSFKYNMVDTKAGSRKIQILVTDGITETKIYEDPNLSSSGTDISVTSTHASIT